MAYKVVTRQEMEEAHYPNAHAVPSHLEAALETFVGWTLVGVIPHEADGLWYIFNKSDV